jgi:hypothetical protein
MGTLNWIHACWNCDGCGKDFIVDIDSAWKPPTDWDTTKMAEDAVRNGFIVPRKGQPLIGHSSSVQHDLVLCGECTSIADGIGEEDHQPTRDEIISELGARI